MAKHCQGKSYSRCFSWNLPFHLAIENQVLDWCSLRGSTPRNHSGGEEGGKFPSVIPPNTGSKLELSKMLWILPLRSLPQYLTWLSTSEQRTGKRLAWTMLCPLSKCSRILQLLRHCCRMPWSQGASSSSLLTPTLHFRSPETSTSLKDSYVTITAKTSTLYNTRPFELTLKSFIS